MRYSILIAPIFFLAIPATASAADCQPVFVGGDQSVTIDGVAIEPLGSATRDFQIRVQNAAGAPGAGAGMSGSTSGESCEAIIRVIRVGAPPGLDFPPYSLRASGNQKIEILADVASGGTVDSDVVIDNAPSGPGDLAVPFQLGVATEWGLRAGTYIDELELALIDRSGSVLDRQPLTIAIVIPRAVSLRLTGAVVGGGLDGPAQVNLGSLSSTEETRSERFGALILSTAPYLVRFSSVNRGMLLHEQGREQIPYRLFFDGALVDLAGANEFPYVDRSAKSGDTRPMSIVVPPVVALAGRYSDRITMTVTAM